MYLNGINSIGMEWNGMRWNGRCGSGLRPAGYRALVCSFIAALRDDACIGVAGSKNAVVAFIRQNLQARLPALRASFKTIGHAEPATAFKWLCIRRGIKRGPVAARCFLLRSGLPDHSGLW